MVSIPNQYPVHLTPEERQALEEVTRDRRASAAKIRRARALLLSDHDRPGGRMTGPQVADALGMHLNTVARLRRSFALQGGRPALERKARETPAVAPIVDGRVEAHLIAICTGPPPEGRCRWTMELIAGELVRREVVESISGETVRRALKKIGSSPGRRGRGASRSGTAPGSSPRWRRSSTSTPSRTTSPVR
jgi:hypothetical protein